MITHRYLRHELLDMIARQSPNSLAADGRPFWRGDIFVGIREWCEQQGGGIVSAVDGGYIVYDITLPTEGHFLMMKLAW